VAPIVATVAMFPEGKAAIASTKDLSRAFEQLSKRDSFAQAHAVFAG
jgi:hypothetical protein